MMRNAKLHCCVSYLVLLFLFLGCSTTSEGRTGQPNILGTPVPPTKQGEAYGRFLRAVVEERQGQFASSLAAMETVSDLDPGEMTPLLHLIRGYMRQEDFAKGREVVEQMLEVHPENANLWALLGRIQYKQDDVDAAMDAFNKSIELEPRNLVNLGALIELQESTNSLVDSIDIFERLIENNPDSARLHFQLGLNLTRIQDTEGARRALEKTLELNPNMVRAYYLLALIYLEMDENEKSVEYMQEYLKREKDAYKAYEYLVGGLTRLGRYEEAIATLSEAMKTPFVNTTAHLEGVYIHLRWKEKLEEAEKMIPPSGAPIFGQLFTAIVRKEKGEPYLPLLESLPNVEGDLDNECTLYVNDLLYIFKFDGFGDWFTGHLKSFQAEADSFPLAFILGRTYLSMEKTEDAVAVLETALANFGTQKLLHYYLSSSYEELNDFENTERHLKAYLELDPNDSDILNFLGYLYAEHGVKLEEAEQLLNKAIDQDPENPYYLDSLGWVYFKQGKPKEALELIQKAMYGMESEDPILRDHLGDIYLKLGDRNRAVKEWERSLRLDAEQESVLKKIEKYKPRD